MIENVLQQHQKTTDKALTGALIKEIQDQYKGLLNFISRYEEITLTLFSKQDNDSENILPEVVNLIEIVEYRRKMLDVLDDWVGERKTDEARVSLTSFDKELQKIISEMEAAWITKQSKERFLPAKGENFYVRTVRTLKQVTLSLHGGLVHIQNKIRNKTVKREHTIPAWKQRIPAKNLTLWHYDYDLIRRFTPMADEAIKNLALLAYEVWRLDDILYERMQALLVGDIDREAFSEYKNNTFLKDLKALKEKVEVERKHLRPTLVNEIKETHASFAKDTEKGGTLELPGILRAGWIRRHRNKKIRKSHIRQIRRRHNTLYALADDWKFNQEIYILTGLALKQKQFLRTEITSREKAVSDSMKQIKRFMTTTLKEIQGSDIKELTNNLQQLKFMSGKRLYNKIIPGVVSLMKAQVFPDLLQNEEQKLTRLLSSKNRERILIDGFDPSRPYRNKSLETISLIQLLEFEISGDLKRSISKTGKQSQEKLAEFENRFQDLGRMVLFNLESALLMIEKQKEATAEIIAEEAKSGINRAIERYEDLYDDFMDFLHLIIKDFDHAIINFNQGLIDLTDNENVEKIRYRLLKARALKKRESFFRLIGQKSKTIWVVIKSTSRTARGTVTSFIQKIRSKLGIQQLSKEISIEVSDFLAKDHELLQKLPFVYRRLFANEPLEDDAFYYPREEEKTMLLQTYKKWEEGSFMSTLLYGEKGSGISTFVHMTLEEMGIGEQKAHTFLISQRILNERDLLHHLGISIRQKAFTSLEDFENYATEFAPLIVFVDKLHMLYLRQPAGFQLLKRLFEIISKTNKNVFWICSCGLYAAELLNQSVGLFGYFPQLIRMKRLETDKIREIIMLRHNASGYKLHFSASSLDIAQRGFQKKNDVEKQQFLKEKFFERLNSLSQSNISYALQLWLHSASRVEDNMVYMDSLDLLDLSFVHNLPDEVIFGLHALVLHESLTRDQLALIMNTGAGQAYLMLMRLKDRGIVVERNEIFGIHPLLYRESLALLKNKNLIY